MFTVLVSGQVMLWIYGGVALGALWLLGAWSDAEDEMAKKKQLDGSK